MHGQLLEICVETVLKERHDTTRHFSDDHVGGGVEPFCDIDIINKFYFILFMRKGTIGCSWL